MMKFQISQQGLKPVFIGSCTSQVSENNGYYASVLELLFLFIVTHVTLFQHTPAKQLLLQISKLQFKNLEKVLNKVYLGVLLNLKLIMEF